MPKLYGFNEADVARIRDTVRDRESGPGRRPIAQAGAAVIAPARVVKFEVVSEEPDADGLWDILILKRKLNGGYEPVSQIKAKLEDINA